MIVRLLLALAFLSAFVSAQSRFTYDDPSGSGAVNVTVTMSGGASYGIGLGFARFEIENTTTQAQSIGVVLKPHRFFQGDVQATRTVLAEPGLSRFFLPIALPPDRCMVEVAIGGVTYSERVNYPGTDNIVRVLARPGATGAGPRLGARAWPCRCHPWLRHRSVWHRGRARGGAAARFGPVAGNA